ncbi:MAG: acyltransferase [Rhizobiaceae bacterium]|nr:acyltransferase [Rhizobiaceae bacterium]MCV0404718.1 acyltransferase [Rhizobiaceae bacterium]
MHFRILETWRLTAALLVMIWHFLRYAPTGAEAASAALYRLLPLMEMFLMISGFLIMMRYADTLLTSRGSLMRFLVRRVARLYPLYLATLAFFAVIGLLIHLGFGQSNWPGRYDFSLLPANILLIQGWGVSEHLTFNYVAWTLSAEWFCYLLFPVVVLVARRWGIGGLVMLAFITISGLEVATTTGIIPFHSWMKADTWGAYRAFADFVIGAGIALAVTRTPPIRIGRFAPWLSMTLALVAMQAELGDYLVLMLLALSIWLAAKAEKTNPDSTVFLAPLAPVGRVSFGIYLIHPVVETVMFSIIWKMALEPTDIIGFYVYWVLPMAMTVLLAVASERWFEAPLARRIGARFDAATLMRSVDRSAV